MKNFTLQKRSKTKCSYIRGQIMPTRMTAENQYACHDLSVWNKRQQSHLISQNVFFQNIIYPSEKKNKNIGTSSILAWGKSRVLPTDPLFSTIQSYCARMRTNTRRTFQGGAKYIPQFLIVSVSIFARQGILTECSQLPDYVEPSHERWVLHLQWNLN